MGMGQGQRQIYGLCWGLKEAAIRGICPLGCADTPWRRHRRRWLWVGCLLLQLSLKLGGHLCLLLRF